MRKLVMIAASAAFASMSGANAADLGRGGAKDDIYSPEPAFSWTGFYIGGNGGYGWANEHQQVLGAGAEMAHMDFSPEGGIAGGQVGVNWQPRAGGGLVIGAEASLEWSDIGDHTYYDAMPGVPHENMTSLNALGDVSGRLGFAVNRTLIYGKGGVAWGQFDHTTVAMGGTHYTSRTDDRVGWLVGGGVEFAFSPNWSAKVEYNYVDFGTGTYAVISPTGRVAQSVDYTDTVNVIKGGINYRFGSPQADALK